jgi:hypothetical protein
MAAGRTPRTVAVPTAPARGTGGVGGPALTARPGGGCTGLCPAGILVSVHGSLHDHRFAGDHGHSS